MSDSNEDQSKDGTGTMLLGFAVIIIGIAAIFFAGRAIYQKWISPPPSMVSLSAYFVDEAGNPISASPGNGAGTAHIRIQGQIPGASSGTARVMVEAPSLQFQQSVSAPIVNGRFQIEDPAFTALKPGVPATITADVSSGKETSAVSIQLNSKVANSFGGFYWVDLVIIIIYGYLFFYAFTGQETPKKRRVAIVYSYLVIALSLSLPIAAPYYVYTLSTDAFDKMVGAPVGLVVTCTSSEGSRQRQWAFNIGGYSFIPRTPAIPAAAVPTPTTPAASAPASSPESPAPSDNVVGPAPVQPAASVSRDCGNISSTTVANTTPAAETATSSLGNPSGPPVVMIEGGLVIPLYVIILSVLGGAINMTRKVPSFQREDEAATLDAWRPVSRMINSASSAVIGMVSFISTPANPSSATPTSNTKLPTPEPAEQARQLDDEINPLVLEQLLRTGASNAAVAHIQSLVDQVQTLYATADPDHPLPYASYDEWFASHPRLREILRGNWRVALLNQYMYLISAPFLAVVTYYLLDLLGLSKPGVVVVLSFSVGLISEKIVTWILGVASGYLQAPKGA